MLEWTNKKINKLFEQEEQTVELFKKEGLAKEGDNNFDEKQLALGRKIEIEHAESEDIAEEIAKDHLKEIPDYYTRLLLMEKIAKNECYGINQDIINLFKQNPNPSDEIIHKYAAKKKANVHVFEQAIYRLLSNIINGKDENNIE